MNPTTSRVRSIALSKATSLLSRNAQTTAPIVLPTAVPSVKNPNGTPFIKENRTAPKATPGQNRFPKSKIAARAIPAGGHTKATLPDRKDASLPTSPPTK